MTEFALFPGAPDVVELFLPGVALAVLGAAAVAIPLSNRLRSGRWVAFLLAASVGAILAVTMMPVSSAWLFDTATAVPVCNLESFAAPTRAQLSTLNQVSLNVALFVPFGLVVGVLPRWSQVVFTAVLGVMLPPAIEMAQAVLTPLNRVCSGADVADNLTGFLVGLLAALVLLRPLVCAMSGHGRPPATQVRSPARAELVLAGPRPLPWAADQQPAGGQPGLDPGSRGQQVRSAGRVHPGVDRVRSVPVQRHGYPSLDGQRLAADSGGLVRVGQCVAERGSFVREGRQFGVETEGRGDEGGAGVVGHERGDSAWPPGLGEVDRSVQRVEAGACDARAVADVVQPRRRDE
jgi:hypothetical protein